MIKLSKLAISSFLSLALLITGAVAAVVVASPGLVTLGLYALILPGLILGFTPTVFLYLVAFSIPWFLLNRRGVVTGVLSGLAGMATAGYVLPFLLNIPTGYWEFRAKAKETSPTSKAGGAKIIALEASHPDAGTCGDLCRTLLFNGLVQRVVVLTKNNGDAAGGNLSFRIERMSNCPDASSKSAFRFDWLDRRDRVPEELVRLRIARGECLMEDRKWNGKPDLVLERVSEDLGTRPAPLTLAPGEVHAEGLQLKRADGRVIARQSTIVARRFTLPLLPVFVGYMPGAYFDFSRHQVPNSDVNVNAASFLGRFTDLKMAPPQSVDSGAVAARIDEVLADPLVPDTEGAFALIRDYFDSLSKGQVTSTDVRRLARLIADPRMKRFQLPIYKLDPSQRLELRNPILERLWQLGEAKEWLLYFQLAGNLRLMPAGAFRKAEPLVDRLLSEPELRRFAPVLVQRLAERGPAESARLLSILHEAFSTSYPTSRADDLYRYYQGDFINATLQGLCRLGPQAQPQAGKSMLETLSAIAASGSIPPSRQELDIWRATLVSLGASPTEFDPPGKRGFDPYHQKLQNIANSGCEQP